MSWIAFFPFIGYKIGKIIIIIIIIIFYIRKILYLINGVYNQSNKREIFTIKKKSYAPKHRAYNPL